MASHGHSAKRKGGHEQKHRPVSRSNKIINPHRTISLKDGSAKKKGTHLRDKATIERIAMYKDKPIHNAKGEFLSGAYMSRTPDKPIVRVAPDRRWFGNTRVVDQTELSHFREVMSQKVNDPYTVVMRSKKLPMGLLNDTFKVRIYIQTQRTHGNKVTALLPPCTLCFPLLFHDFFLPKHSEPSDEL
jgi:hypothetical protein